MIIKTWTRLSHRVSGPEIAVLGGDTVIHTTQTVASTTPLDSFLVPQCHSSLLPDDFHFRLTPEEPPPELVSFTLTKEQQSGLTGIHRTPQMVHAGFNYREYPD